MNWYHGAGVPPICLAIGIPTKSDFAIDEEAGATSAVFPALEGLDG